MVCNLIRDGIIPDIIDRIPRSDLLVVYPNGARVDGGNELTPTLVKHEPCVRWDGSDGAYYLLLMVDIDYPSRSSCICTEWHHWLVVNIPGSDICQGQALSFYIGSVPGIGTGMHRYVFLLFRQPDKIQFDEEKLSCHSAHKRANFNTHAFVKKYNLGLPVSVNYFVAQWDEYVPKLENHLYKTTEHKKVIC